jgi:L-threonylcarbamoyladenylate synthase
MENKDFLKKRQEQPSNNSGKFADDISKCLEVLKAGGIIVYPTDTVWGIGCDATNEEAVKKVYELKGLSESENMLILVEHADRLGRHVKQIPEVAIQLIEVNDKPMSIVYPGAVNLAKNLIGSDGSAGIRITTDEFCKKLIASFNKPIVSTSANLNEDDVPETFREISDEIKNRADYIVRWRQNDPSPGKPSSIIKVGVKGDVKIVRN